MTPEKPDIQDLITADGRYIRLPGVDNLRDIGGYPTRDGASVRWATLFRSDGLHRLDSAGAAGLADLDLHTIVDLRTDEERRYAPSVTAALQARTVHVCLVSADDLRQIPPELAAVYRHLIDECGGAVAAAIGMLCGLDALPALVHCSAGKDRTGVVVALILALLGVPDEVIAADYALSAGYLNAANIAAIGRLQAGRDPGEELPAGLLASPPWLILDVLARARAAGGGSVEGYLRLNGLGPAALTALRQALVG